MIAPDGVRAHVSDADSENARPQHAWALANVQQAVTAEDCRAFARRIVAAQEGIPEPTIRFWEQDDEAFLQQQFTALHGSGCRLVMVISDDQQLHHRVKFLETRVQIVTQNVRPQTVHDVLHGANGDTLLRNIMTKGFLKVGAIVP
ncbi:hypothetical protein AAVH_35940 [Aphelenchoides avenae]|nr:hypothetical protein AAVH_35940 [Aphelenchus avenae]